jgi:D-alanine-D-alanine ligase
MKNVGIFCGGFSSEAAISILSAKTIASNFPKQYRVFLIEVSEDKWEVCIEDEKIVFHAWDFQFEYQSERIKLDFGIIYIHGNPGENGKLQAFFELRNFKYINSGALASELSFDKWYCNQFLKGFGINVAKSLLLRSISDYTSEEILEFLGLPCFVKPADSGSSFGISKANKIEEVQPALQKAFQEGGSVVIESFLNGIEITCGVYRNEFGIEALPLTEIATENDFFDYEAKYLGKSKEITPARISKINAEVIQELAKKIYLILNLRSIARIDFMLVEDVPYLIEVNTTPGFSPASIVPQMIHVAGKTITEFWQEIIDAELTFE